MSPGGVFNFGVQMDKGWSFGPLKDLDGLKKSRAVCDKYASVPCYKGEDDRCETTDVPAAELHYFRIIVGNIISRLS